MRRTTICSRCSILLQLHPRSLAGNSSMNKEKHIVPRRRHRVLRRAASNNHVLILIRRLSIPAIQILKPNNLQNHHPLIHSHRVRRKRRRYERHRKLRRILCMQIKLKLNPENPPYDTVLVLDTTAWIIGRRDFKVGCRYSGI